MAISDAMRAQIREAARGFERAFVHKMLEEMQKAQLEEGLCGSSASGKTRNATFNAMLADVLAEAEPLGLAEMVEEELVRGVEAGSGEKPAAFDPELFNIFRWDAKDTLEDAEEFGG